MSNARFGADSLASFGIQLESQANRASFIIFYILNKKPILKLFQTRRYSSAVCDDMVSPSDVGEYRSFKARLIIC